ncbi:unnamed protein product [Brassica rapa]|uniref:BnaA04g05340D protein n=2 Tax=Brassica TaxID=3705 RepID=A0A078G9W6_BRANA|nr:unnamed protein product [Brassica rapa]CDY23225.1 BnaA04g05340D [Brassica napus]VDD11283.1 unnamed protein product [Brassica rapa]
MFNTETTTYGFLDSLLDVRLRWRSCMREELSAGERSGGERNWEGLGTGGGNCRGRGRGSSIRFLASFYQFFF